MYHRVLAPFALTTDELNQEAVAQAAAMSGALANRNLININPGLKGGFDYNQAVRDQSQRQQAELSYIGTSGALNLGQADLARAQGGYIAQQASPQAALTTETAKSTAADTYKSVQGGGISAATYDILPWAIGGLFVIGMTGWIIFAVNKKRTKSRR